jgi:hypothetical protein
LAAHPPVQPEPTTMASNGSFGATICMVGAVYQPEGADFPVNILARSGV